MAEARCAPTAQSRADALLDRILIANVIDAPALLAVVETQLPQLAAHHSIAIIIIDSIAGVFRGEHESHQETAARAGILNRLASTLRKLSDQLNAPVVVINQVTDLVLPHLSLDAPRVVVPALGLAWSCHVLVRLLLSRIAMHDSAGRSLWRRRLHVLHAPHLGNIRAEFAVLPGGVRGVPS